MQPENMFFAELGRLAGSQQRENQVSRTFAACFNESRAFRRVVLDVFWRALGNKHGPISSSRWRCSAEVRTPKPGGGRVDLHFSPVDSSGLSAGQSFYVESKVESPVTKQQVKKYLEHGVRPLLVITKYRPDEPVESNDVHGVRWQDVHQALRGVTVTGPVAKQVCRWMADYLEELDMAYREDLTVTDIASCGKLFRAVRSDNWWKQVSSRSIFEIIHALDGMLDDLRQDFRDSHPQLEVAPYHHGRTHYAKCRDTDDGSVYHYLRWSITKGQWQKWQFSCSICWPNNPQEKVTYFVQLEGSTVRERDSEIPLSKVASKGVLDRAKLYAHLEACARKWGVT